MANANCLFCRIVAGQAPSEKVAAGEGVLAIRDKYPQAPVHVLVLTEEHIDSAHDLDQAHGGLIAGCFELARKVAEQEGIADGYRMATNIGRRGGQGIPHLHFHVLGGRQLGRLDAGG